MQRQPAKRPAGELCQFGLVPRITQHRVTSFRKVHTNLISPACFKPATNEGDAFQALLDLVMRDGQFAPVDIRG
ncbi:MAG: hypothetical protein HC898_10825 [Phycisphaerales bacterium]|nr:hypothetical protein [Phycisphaerales bacterium]